MKKYIIIIAIIIASMATVFGQNDNYNEKSRYKYPISCSGDTIVSDSIFVVIDLMGFQRFSFTGEWQLEKLATIEQVKKCYGVELQTGIYFIYRNGKEESKFIVK
jgi:hypothetical protein